MTPKSTSDLTTVMSMLKQYEGNGRARLETCDTPDQGSSRLKVHARKATVTEHGKQGLQARLSLTQSMYSESALDADALGFMAKMLVQTTLPHRAQPGNQYTRTDGDVTLAITDLTGVGLPYGAYPRLILVWMTTEALRTGERNLELGRSLSSFMEQLGLQCTGGTGARFQGLDRKWNDCLEQPSRLGGTCFETIEIAPEVPISSWRRIMTSGGLRRSCREAS